MHVKIWRMYSMTSKFTLYKLHLNFWIKNAFSTNEHQNIGTTYLLVNLLLGFKMCLSRSQWVISAALMKLY